LLQATKVETARRAENSKAAVRRLAQKEGFEGDSLFFWPSPADKARYPGLKYLWGFGPDVVPYDTIHLFLSNIVARLWELFAGKDEKLGDDQPCVISKATREAIGREIKAGRPTIPLTQARALRYSQTFEFVQGRRLDVLPTERWRSCTCGTDYG